MSVGGTTIKIVGGIALKKVGVHYHGIHLYMHLAKIDLIPGYLTGGQVELLRLVTTRRFSKKPAKTLLATVPISEGKGLDILPHYTFFLPPSVLHLWPLSTVPFRPHFAGFKSFNVPARECHKNARGEHNARGATECIMHHTLKDAEPAKCGLNYLVLVTWHWLGMHLTVRQAFGLYLYRKPSQEYKHGFALPMNIIIHFLSI